MDGGGGGGRSVFSKMLIQQASGDSQVEKDVLSETQADAMARSEVERSGDKVENVTPPWYETHHLKPMSLGIMLGLKPLEKHIEQCFEQPQLLQHWHKAVFYLSEVCLHSFDDPKFLKDAFNTMI
jgi:hypothetical protein